MDARPFDKVDKQARLGLEDGESIVSFFDMVLLLSAEYEERNSRRPGVDRRSGGDAGRRTNPAPRES